MEFHIAVLPGDGIGPEVVAEGVRVLEAVGGRFGHIFGFTYDVVGGAAIDEFGTALRPETVDRCRQSHAVLFGAVGGPRWDDPRSPVRPEQAILGLRRGMGLFVNIRPIKIYPSLADSGPLKPSVIRGVDMVILRELTGGLYFAQPKRQWTTARGRRVVDTLRYTEQEIRRILRVGFELAQARRRYLVSVDKANVMESSRLWRELAMDMAGDYPDVTLEHRIVDSFAMQLITSPARFDVIVTENTFGDILSDEAAVLAASLGMLPSASLDAAPQTGGRRRRRVRGLYEPIHGSAPDIAGQGKANPLAMILSVGLLLRYSLGLSREADAVDDAVEEALRRGHRTPDIAGPRERALSTQEMGRLVVDLVATA